MLGARPVKQQDLCQEPGIYVGIQPLQCGVQLADQISGFVHAHAAGQPVNFLFAVNVGYGKLCAARAP